MSLLLLLPPRSGQASRPTYKHPLACSREAFRHAPEGAGRGEGECGTRESEQCGGAVTCRTRNIKPLRLCSVYRLSVIWWRLPVSPTLALAWMRRDRSLSRRDMLTKVDRGLKATYWRRRGVPPKTAKKGRHSTHCRAPKPAHTTAKKHGTPKLAQKEAPHLLQVLFVYCARGPAARRTLHPISSHPCHNPSSGRRRASASGRRTIASTTLGSRPASNIPPRHPKHPANGARGLASSREGTPPPTPRGVEMHKTRTACALLLACRHTQKHK